MTADALVSFDGVSVRYPGADRHAISDLMFSVGPGERVALVGPSGAGKSTILALAAGLTLPTRGRVEVLGVGSDRLGRRAHRQERSRVGIISQDFALIGPLRVASNVAAGRLGRWSWLRAARSLVRPEPIEEIAAALQTVGIAEKLWERADNLSGGQMQRTAVARALFQRPDLLLADEPVSALDPARSESVMAVLAEQASNGDGKAMIASMHDAPLALQYSDRIIAMRDGRMVFDRPSHEVSPELLAKLYHLERSPG